MLKANPQYFSLFELVQRLLRSIKNPFRRARLVHEMVDECMKEVLSDPVVQKYSACKKGCDACCHTQVSVTWDEVLLMAGEINDAKVLIDRNKLEYQAKYSAEASTWYQLPYEERGCVFLKNGECTIYESRPSVCRTNYVIGSPDNCSTKEGLERPVRLLNTKKADMVIIGAYHSSAENGTLPRLLLKALRLKEKRSKSRRCQNKKSLFKESPL